MISCVSPKTTNTNMQTDVSLVQLTDVMLFCLFNASSHLAVRVGEHPGEDLAQSLELHAADGSQTNKILVRPFIQKMFR